MFRSMEQVEPWLAEVRTWNGGSGVSLRWAPTVRGMTIFQLPGGSRVVVVSEGNGWSQVVDTVSGYTGFMASRYLVPAQAWRDGEVNTDRAAADTGATSQNSALQRMFNVYGAMVPVEPYLAEVAPVDGVDTLPLRWAPTSSGLLVERLERGGEVVVLAEGGGWAQVMDDRTGVIGFAFSRYLAPSDSDLGFESAGDMFVSLLELEGAE